MILIVDVYYKKDKACVCAIEIESFENERIKNRYISSCKDFNKYEPGKFYKRELPCILQILNRYKLNPKIVIIDGYVYLDGYRKKGLGGYLYDELNKDVKIIGVAKSRYYLISDEFAIYRRNSKKPLYITSAGIEIEKAKNLIKNMRGDYRIPDLLKIADRCSKECFKEDR